MIAETQRPASADIGVADNDILSRVLHQRRRAFEEFGVGFAAVGVFEEDAVAAANGGLAVAEGIPGKSKARGRIEQMALQAARRNAPATPQ